MAKPIQYYKVQIMSAVTDFDMANARLNAIAGDLSAEVL